MHKKLYQKHYPQLISIWSLFFAVVLFSVYFSWHWLINHDVAYFILAAERLLDRGYYDQIEANLPFVTYFSVLPVLLGDFLNIGSIAGFYLFVTLIMLGCTCLAYKELSAHEAFQDNFMKASLLATMSVGLFLIPALCRIYGQRENLFVAMITPYLIHNFVLLNGCNKKSHLRDVCIGVLAGIGFAFKPQFIAFLFFMEFYMAYRLGFRQLYRRREPVAALCTAGLLYTFNLLVGPHYFEQLSTVKAAYWGHMTPWLIILKHFLIFSLPIFLVMGFLVILKRKDLYGMRAAFLGFVCLVGAGPVLFLQGTSYSYRMIPLYYFALTTLFFIFALNKNWRRLFFPVLIIYAAIILKNIGLWPPFREYSSYRKSTIELAQEIKNYQHQGGAIFLSWDLLRPFPATLLAGESWKLRAASMFQLQAAYPKEPENMVYNSCEAMPPYEKLAYDTLVEDLKNEQPAAIFYASGVRKDFNLLDYLALCRSGSLIKENYRLAKTLYDVSIYERYKKSS